VSRVRDFLLCYLVHTDSGAHPAYPMGTGGLSYPWDKAASERNSLTQGLLQFKREGSFNTIC